MKQESIIVKGQRSYNHAFPRFNHFSKKKKKRKRNDWKLNKRVRSCKKTSINYQHFVRIGLEIKIKH